MRWFLQTRDRVKQRTPPGDWHTWLNLAGRGYGKTRVGAEDLVDYARRHPGSRQAIIAEDFGAARDVCVEGESGILSILPDSCWSWNKSLGQLTFSNGSRADCYSGEKPNDLRGPQFHRAWVDELAKMRYQRAVWDMLSFALRLGDRPQVVVTTTPKPTELILELVGSPSTHLTQGSTFENEANLAESFLADILSRYEGRALGRQELYAELVMDYEGALVRRTWIDHVAAAPPLERVAVGVDPSTWGPEAGRAYDDSAGEGVETGIVAVGLGVDGDAYVLEDASMRGSPNAWAGAALDLYHRVDAHALVVEVNVGPWVISTIRGVEQTRGLPPARIVNVRPGRGEGKSVRLEPVAGLYEQTRLHHVGHLPLLEDQLVSWDPRQRWSPDRIDALVHAVTFLEPWVVHAPPETSVSALRAARLPIR